MKRTAYAFVLAALTFAGCAKVTPTPNHSSNDSEPGYFTKNVTLTGLKVAERINGIVVCTIDEEILEEGVNIYYQATSSRYMHVVEYNEGTPNNFFMMTAKMRINKQWAYYAFELIPFMNINGTEEFYLPVAGSEQKLKGPGKGVCKFIITSPSTGHGVSMNSIHTSSTSIVNTDDFGTNKFITILLTLI